MDDSERTKKPRQNLAYWKLSGRLTDEGGIIPLKAPVKGRDGYYLLPSGRRPLGMNWHGGIGQWMPIEKLPEDILSSSKRTTSSKKKEDWEMEESSDDDEHYESLMQNEQEEEAEVDEEASEESEDSFVLEDDDEPILPAKEQKRSKRQRCTPVLGVHPRSGYQEQERFDDLTLYEIHRKPRAVDIDTKRLTCNANLLWEHFRCVICLDIVRNTRVLECLHRFCEECIERSLKLGKNECPMCRAPVPSRRNLRQDSRFDELITCMVADSHQEPAELGPSTAAQEQRHFQQAIARKRRAIEEPAVPRPLITDKIVSIRFWRHPRERVLPTLEMPFIRLDGRATLLVLQTFLREKLGVHSPMTFSDRTKDGKVYDTNALLKTTLWQVLHAPTVIHTQSSNYTKLYYRRRPSREANRK